MSLRTKASYSDEVTQREKENLEVAYRAACEGIVLLKNDGTLPLKTKKVALYGAGASMTIKGGTGSGEVNERHSVSVLEGMTDRGFEVTTLDWIENWERLYAAAESAYQTEKKKRINILKPSFIMEMLMDNFRAPCGVIDARCVERSHTDSCVYVLSRQAGEGGDRRAEKGDFLLTDEERESIRFCAEHYPHFVLAINAGSSIDMHFAEEIDGINAIVYLCQLGTEGGHAFADILSGAVSPSGKLSDTWARQYTDLPFANEYSYLNGDLEKEYYKEGIYVGYRYFDSFGVAPAYPFGFGLSYTDFTMESCGVSTEGSAVAVTANVTNCGALYSGKEVAQLYVSPPVGEMDKEYQSLAAFAKTETLSPGESQKVVLTFDMKDIASYRERGGVFVLEAGEYVLRLGNSSRNTVPAGVVRLEHEVIVSRHEHICPLCEPLEELKAPNRAAEFLPAELPCVTVDTAAFETVVYHYETPAVCNDPRVKALLDTLTPEEMTDIVVGAGFYQPATGFTMPGSVGNTTSKFWDRGLANVALCDGPAGLRVQKISVEDSKGKVKPVEMPIGVFNALPAFIRRFMVGDPGKGKVLYQYTTAFPVANALAQSWNTALMAEVGNAIYREMKEYGCTYWLAPAINIHRNPLCGRNFEYFSEDPCLSGTMATAIIGGVQQEEGYYVTVKHFACNNQEDNRMKVSSNVSERALREIYLRGFERCVRKGGAKGIMTSYNRLNKVYTANSYDLCTKVLRNEWGFDGVVMTDWFATRGREQSARAMAAGNDLIMPGLGGNKKDILKGIHSGLITEEDVRRCCGNVIRAILNSATQREFIG
ncbi:MAG: glycoside hydrolase family 3 C-terminal domain-containing protein [Oscillospiraceae bacterium]|nr:glycoside hydrolase family 3 C-terminal domain-containing protein [Oscillospiraceae bacterium]